MKDLPELAKLNPSQKRTIVSVTRACLEAPAQPRISLVQVLLLHRLLSYPHLVQGPPGTGKSSTLCGLVLHMLYSRLQGENLDSMPRLLVTAPSNAAVDELALKLMKIRKQLPEKIRFRMVRWVPRLLFLPLTLTAQVRDGEEHGAGCGGKKL